EAEESDGTHAELPLFATILTNVEVDHLDHFGSLGGIVDSFDRYLAGIPGPKVLCADDERCVALAGRVGERGGHAVTYGMAPGAEFRAVDITPQRGSFRFDVEHRGTRLGTIDLPLRGVHNVLNATA